MAGRHLAVVAVAGTLTIGLTRLCTAHGRSRYQRRKSAMVPRMLSALTRKMRLWGAAGMAAFYAVCLLAPVAAFAFGGGEAHCLTQDNHGLGSVHVHDDGTAHRHAPDPADAD